MSSERLSLSPKAMSFLNLNIIGQEKYINFVKILKEFSFFRAHRKLVGPMHISPLFNFVKELRRLQTFKCHMKLARSPTFSINMKTKEGGKLSTFFIRCRYKKRMERECSSVVK